MTDVGGQIGVEPDGRWISVRLDDSSAAVRLNRFWLRDNAPSTGDRGSLFRDYSVCDLAEDLTIVGADLEHDRLAVRFSDGCVDSFDISWLRQRQARIERGDHAAPAAPWRAGFEPRSFAIGDLEPGGVSHFQLLESLVGSGVALVSGLPHDPSSTERLASRLGRVRHTDFGRIFDIVSEPNPFTPSQSTAALDPHTDDPYRYTPSGISMLHCMEASDNGGESSIVDGFAVATDLRDQHPEDFELLSTVVVPFVHRRDHSVEQGDAVYLRAEAPIIATDHRGRVKGIRFHERSMDVLDIDADLAEHFYPALRRFARAVRSPDYAWSHRLAPGEAIVYDNQRVLHGRSGFDGPQTRRRHLRLCTVDRDQVHSNLRRLREAHRAGTEHEDLPAGNLSLRHPEGSAEGEALSVEELPHEGSTLLPEQGRHVCAPRAVELPARTFPVVRPHPLVVGLDSLAIP
jgi:gamma-butyrobetaine dioxygenase